MAGASRRDGAAWCYAAGATGFIAYAVAAGQDANWDLQNYHDYTGFALLHWRDPVDVTPGGPQSFLNPLPYIPPYLLRHSLPPVMAGAAVAALQAAVFPLLWAVSGHMIAATGWRGAAIRAAMVATAATGAIGLSEIGTSFADLQLAGFGVAAVLAMLRASPESGAAMRVHLLAGACVGAACGLKLTHAVLVPGLLTMAAYPWPGWRRLGCASGLVVLGAAAGGLASDGWWAAYLLYAYDNPAFPYLNTVFHAPAAAISNFSDVRFLPHGVLDALAYPLRIATGAHPTAEIPFRDARLLAATALCAGFAAQFGRRKFWVAAGASAEQVALLRLSAFFAIGLVAWLLAFAIQRYAMVLDMAAGLLVPAILARVLPRRIGVAAGVLAAAGLMAWTVPGDWWRRPWSDAYVAKLPAAVSVGPAAFVWAKPPFGYWVRSLPPGAAAAMVQADVQIPGGALQRRLDALLQEPPGGLIWHVAFDVPLEAPEREALGGHGLALAPPCYRAASLWWFDTVFCRMERVGVRPFAASDLRIGQTIAFTPQGAGFIYETAGWSETHVDGIVFGGRPATLVMRPEQATSPLVLALAASAVEGPDTAGAGVAVTLGGGAALAFWAVLGSEAGVRTVCLPQAWERDGVVELHFAAVAAGAAAEQMRFTLHAMSLRPAVDGECGER